MNIDCVFNIDWSMYIDWLLRILQIATFIAVIIKTIFESTKKLSNLTSKQNRPLQFLLPLL